MPPAKRLIAEAYCKGCKTSHGKIFEKEVREGMFESVSEPKKMPLYCNVCECVLVRRAL